MTEDEWLDECNPETMLQYLNECGKLTERKARLFACACVWRVWLHLEDERSKRAVAIAERLADRLVGITDQREAFGDALTASRHPSIEGTNAAHCARAAFETVNVYSFNTAVHASRNVSQAFEHKSRAAARAEQASKPIGTASPHHR